MGPLTEVPALVRIENEHWIFERIEASTLQELTHRLVLQTTEGEEVLGVTEDLSTALEVARCMAENDQKVVLIQALLTSKEVPDGLDHALIHEVKEATKKDTSKIHLSGRNLPRFFGFLIEISNQTGGLLDAAAVVFLLRCHVDRSFPATSPL